MPSSPFALWCAASLVFGAAAGARIAWEDVAPLHGRLEAQGIARETFASRVEQIHLANLRRVREGDLDHLVFYLLQSSRFTLLPPLEPALTAKALVESLDPVERETFFRAPASAAAHVAPAVRSRIAALLQALDSRSADPRLRYFRSLVTGLARREHALADEYLRVMRFVYQKEFVAQQAGQAAVAELYRTRGLSTDTAVEAGFLVHQGLGIVRALDADRRIRRVLVVGPGLDLAPRTALVEEGPPQSYQPWAVIDALLSLGLSDANDLEVVAADINPRVVQHLRDASRSPPVLTLVSEIRQGDGVRLTAEYREYFAQLGRSLGASTPREGSDVAGRLGKTVQVRPGVASLLRADTLDVVTERCRGTAFDLVVATNVLAYFDDVALMLAMSNIAGMLAPGGILVHNEARPILHELTATLGIPVEQSRHAVIASIGGAGGGLLDSVWVHRKATRR